MKRSASRTCRATSFTPQLPCRPQELSDIPLTDDLATIQRSKAVAVLHREGGNKSRAARALGIDRRKL
jgi:transcriptional regulator with GAF, ATPase, and Fis domain